MIEQLMLMRRASFIPVEITAAAVEEERRISH
jgi:hypothetical protein